ncbi:42937_t:CDS:2 [Gigaspora margarita]|uniref:42937_t:CDS:1 n=1 Tax=Gigaspora margarita TaxID=4874 RepID=A0ABM8VX15_GIGMA|nr:42937_t:CDS:2 [Gigaspora margarita]
MSHIMFSSQGSRGVQCHGLTKFPETNDFMLVIDYMENGDLGTFLMRENNLLMWNDIFLLLKDIFYQLSQIHDNGMIHKDLHPGNLLSDENGWFISDFGFCEGVYNYFNTKLQKILSGEYIISENNPKPSNYFFFMMTERQFILWSVIIINNYIPIFITVINDIDKAIPYLEESDEFLLLIHVENDNYQTSEKHENHSNSEFFPKHNIPDDDLIYLDLNKTSQNSFIFKTHGISSYFSGNYEESISNLNIALSLNPNDLRALHHRGLAHLRLGQYGDAIADFTEVLKINPISKTQMSDHAQKNIKSSFQDDYLGRCLWSLRGFAYLQLRHVKKGFADFSKSFEIRYLDKILINIPSHIQKIKINSRDWIFNEAPEIEFFEPEDSPFKDMEKVFNALEAEPTNAVDLTIRAAVQFNKNNDIDIKSALEYLNKALEIDPNYIHAMQYLA